MVLSTCRISGCCRDAAFRIRSESAGAAAGAAAEAEAFRESREMAEEDQAELFGGSGSEDEQLSRLGARDPAVTGSPRRESFLVRYVQGESTSITSDDIHRIQTLERAIERGLELGGNCDMLNFKESVG